MKPFSSVPSIVAASLVLSGCMAEGPFPSLAQRDVERQPLGEPVRPIPIVADDAALRITLSELTRIAREADADFSTAAALAASAARSAGGPGSDSWVVAQEQLSRAEAARAGTTRALGDLDRLALDRSNLPTSPTDQAALAAARSDVERLAADQQGRLDRLKVLIAR